VTTGSTTKNGTDADTGETEQISESSSLCDVDRLGRLGRASQSPTFALSPGGVSAGCRCRARKFVRKLRGGSQAHLIEATDGCHYLVKFIGNRQHRRTLVNELIRAAALQHLRIAAPATSLVEVTPEFLRQNPKIYLATGGQRKSVKPGIHLGSMYPGDPSKVAVYELVPDTILEKTNNLEDFIGCLIFDKWTGNRLSSKGISTCKGAGRKDDGLLFKHTFPRTDDRPMLAIRRSRLGVL
jgi:hypothetical protein